MAVKVDCLDTVIGIPMQETYCRIVYFQGTKDWVMFSVEHYATEEARHTNRQHVATRDFTAPIEVLNNGFVGLYLWLKEQPGYEQCVDC